MVGICGGGLGKVGPVGAGKLAGGELDDVELGEAVALGGGTSVADGIGDPLARAATPVPKGSGVGPVVAMLPTEVVGPIVTEAADARPTSTRIGKARRNAVRRGRDGAMQRAR